MPNFDPMFFRLLGTALHADLIDASNIEQLKERAVDCAFDLTQKLSDPARLDEIIDGLTQILAAPAWAPDFIMQAIDSTNVDWLADEQAEADLRTALRQLMASLKQYRSQPPQAAKESV